MLLFVLDLSLPVSAESIDRPTTGDRPHQDDTDGMAQRLIATMPTWWFTLTEMDYSFEGGKDYSHSQSHEKDKNCFSMCS